ncbi:MAG: iron dependent repressor, metal binding and dimerization domain protein [candidate division WOR-3 bacterium]
MFAKEIARVGIRYYVQTPNKRFPIEPHLLTPLIHYFLPYLPRSLQRQLLRYFTLWGWITRPTVQECERFLREVIGVSREVAQRDACRLEHALSQETIRGLRRLMQSHRLEPKGNSTTRY